MEKTGQVLSKNGNKIKVELGRSASCGDKCKTCASHCEVPTFIVELDTDLDIGKGDFIEVGPKKGAVMKSLIILYTIPLIFLVSSLVFFNSFFKKMGISGYETYSMLGGFAVLALTFFAIKKLIKGSRFESDTVEIKKVL